MIGRAALRRGCTEPCLLASEFAGQASAIGSRLLVQNLPLEIVGVTPPGFSGPEVGAKFDIALPLCSLTVLHPGDQLLFSRRDLFTLNVMGRLQPGWTIARASEHLAAMSPGLTQATLPTVTIAIRSIVISRFDWQRSPARPE